jgi:hypothetical protein
MGGSPHAPGGRDLKGVVMTSKRLQNLETNVPCASQSVLGITDAEVDVVNIRSDGALRGPTRKNHSLSYIREDGSENSVGGKGFRGNALRRSLTL